MSDYIAEMECLIVKLPCFNKATVVRTFCYRKIKGFRNMIKKTFKYLFVGFFLFSIIACVSFQSKLEAVDWVNMRVGTDGENPTEYGGTVPAVSAPFGMTQWCAATRVNGISRTMYHNRDTTLIGFMATHQPAIWMGDYGFMTFMPQTGSLKIKVDERKLPFNRNTEVMTPYYYKVEYGNDGSLIKTEFTATSRSSWFRIHYPSDNKPVLFLEAGREGVGNIRIFPEQQEIHICNTERHDAHLGPADPGIKGYYVLKFSEPFSEYGIWTGETILTGKLEAEAKQTGGYVTFSKGTDLVDVHMGSSFIDFDQAEVNLEKEIPKTASFKQVVKENRQKWNNYLSKVEIEGGSEEERNIFYTAFFHTLQYPREFSEYGRYYSPFDGKIHDGVSYNAYSLWDTFRAEHPWLQWAAPDRVDDMITSLVQMYQEGGWLPKWPNPSYTNIMIGTHADAVIADAYINGFCGYDVKQAYAAIWKDAYVPPTNDDRNPWGDRALWEGGYEARGGLTHYLQRGYVASDKTYESVARTLEFALDDYCIAQMAKKLGKNADYEDLMKRARNYRNLFNPETNCFQARRSDGTWDHAQAGFTEGANRTYQFCVMQDPKGLIELMGGTESFMNFLDEVFDEGHYRHDNEPCHHYVYLYNYCGRLDKTQERIPVILATNYKNTPDGLSGNDDCGQMSAWYVFSALGFYPVTSASGQYALGIPLFEKVRIQLANGKELIICADKSGKNKTLTNVRLNGSLLTDGLVQVRDLWKGGTLEFLP